MCGGRCDALSRVHGSAAIWCFQLALQGDTNLVHCGAMTYPNYWRCLDLNFGSIDPVGLWSPGPFGDLCIELVLCTWLHGNSVCTDANVLKVMQYCGSDVKDDWRPGSSNNSEGGCPMQACPIENFFEYVSASPVPCFCAAPIRIGYRLKSPSISDFPPYTDLFEVYITSALSMDLYQLSIDSFKWEVGPRLRMYLKIFPMFNNRSSTFNESEVKRLDDIFTKWTLARSNLFGPYELQNFTLLGPYSNVETINGAEEPNCWDGTPGELKKMWLTDVKEAVKVKHDISNVHQAECLTKHPTEKETVSTKNPISWASLVGAPSTVRGSVKLNFTPPTITEVYIPKDYSEAIEEIMLAEQVRSLNGESTNDKAIEIPEESNAATNPNTVVERSSQILPPQSLQLPGRRGLKLAIKHHVTGVHVYTHSQLAVNIIVHGASPNWKYRRLVKEILMLKNSFEIREVLHQFRETNKAADLLARPVPIGYKETDPVILEFPKSGTNKGALAGIIVGAIACVIALFAIAALLIAKRRGGFRSTSRSKPRELFKLLTYYEMKKRIRVT
ncbi:hypothetical protein GIB67_005251 [Kingdonia uniflora]|uniref:RNase H type-1 domain-containing protein n=1 Tax=Kingdonia uniflora TaxID=39325 RepID=A0A7J7NN71_9MAGN|nr:hypothetical protein GIB67_005251 [Kingdonia uniflora]